MTENLGLPVILESQAAAGGAVGAEAVMKAAPDGYTVLATTPGTQVMRQFLTRQMTFDAIKDFTPITLAWETVAVAAVHPSLPVNSMRELIDFAKKFPGKLSYNTSPEELAAINKADIERAAKPVKAAGIQPE